MICEPIYDLPQKIDLETLRQSDKPLALVAQDLKLKAVGAKQYVNQAQAQYNILPMYTQQHDHLKAALSLTKNEYLQSKWHTFIQNVPNKFVHISLYVDYVQKKPEVRNMQLNGKFYGVDNKLAPIPVLDDPRNIYRKFAGKSSRKLKKNKT